MIFVEDIQYSTSSNNWLHNGRFTMPAFYDTSLLFRDNLVFWLGKHILILPTHVCQLSLHKDYHIKQVFVAVPEQYRIGVLW